MNADKNKICVRLRPLDLIARGREKVFVQNRLPGRHDDELVIPGSKDHFLDERGRPFDFFKAQSELLGGVARVLAISFELELSGIDKTKPRVILEHQIDHALCFGRAIFFGEAFVLFERTIADLDPTFREIVRSRFAVDLLFVRRARSQKNRDTIVGARHDERGSGRAETDHRHRAQAVTQQHHIGVRTDLLDLFLQCVLQIVGVKVKTEFEDIIRDITGEKGEHLLDDRRASDYTSAREIPSRHCLESTPIIHLYREVVKLAIIQVFFDEKAY